MKFLRSILSIVIVLAMVAVGVMFALQNEMPVPLDLLVYSFEPKSLALWLLSALAIGGGEPLKEALPGRLRRLAIPAEESAQPSPEREEEPHGTTCSCDVLH